MELAIKGLSVRMHDVSFGAWAAGSLERADERAAAVEAAEFLAITPASAAALVALEKLVPSLPAGSFGSVGGMLAYFHAAGLTHDAARREALAALWQDALPLLPPAELAAAESGGLDMCRVFATLSTLTRKPVQLAIRFRRVREGLDP